MKTNKKNHMLRTVTALALLLTMFVSGLGTVKAYAYTGKTAYETQCHYGSIYDKVVKSLQRAEDRLYNSYLDYAYRMADSKRYEFIGSTIITVAENTEYLKRNFDESVQYSEEEGGFAVRGIKMDKVVQYWSKNGYLVITLYYQGRNDRKPSFVGYRFSKKSNPQDDAIFLDYDMKGNLADIWVVGEFDERFNCNLYKADYSSCDYLMRTAYSLTEIGSYRYAGPTIVKVAKNSTYLKRKFTEEITYSDGSDWYYVDNVIMEKSVKYWDEKGAVIIVCYKNATDKNPSYVIYRYENNQNPNDIIFVTYDMQGNCIESWIVDGSVYGEY